MGLGLLLVPALGGYLFLIGFNLTRYRIEQVNGYHIVFQAACVGVALFLLARLMVLATNMVWPAISVAWQAMLPIEYSGTAALSVAVGWLAPRLLNRAPRWDRDKTRRKAAEEDGDLIGLVIDQALDQSKLIEVSLKEGKCYIGAPMKSAFGIRDAGDIAMTPVASGYRDKRTRDLKISVNYGPVFAELINADPFLDLDDFRIAIPVREVVSARIFSPEAHGKFNVDV